MRLSALKDDPGYNPGCYGVKVFFNGVERRCVFTADEERRLIVAAVLDSRGKTQLNKERDGVLCETLYGDVRIELPDGFLLARREPPKVKPAPRPGR